MKLFESNTTRLMLRHCTQVQTMKLKVEYLVVHLLIIDWILSLHTFKSIAGLLMPYKYSTQRLECLQHLFEIFQI